MKIRHRLTLIFTGLTGIVLVVIFCIVFSLSHWFARETFFQILSSRARISAEFFLEQDEVSARMYEKLQKRYNQSLPGERVRIYSLDHKPRYVSDTAGTEFPGWMIDRVRQERSIQMQYDGRQVVGIFYPDNQGNFVIIDSAEDTVTEKKLNFLFWLLGSCLVVAISAFATLGWFFSGRVLQPIGRIVADVRNIRATNLHLRLATGRHRDELFELAATFNQVLGQLEEAFELQKEFVHNASHELRTPLTAMSGELEVALSRPRTIETYIATLTNVQEEVDRMIALSNALLQLAQLNEADADQWLGKLKLDDLLREFHTEYANQNSEAPITLKMECLVAPVESHWVKGAGPLLKIALQNLVGNALKFSNYAPVLLTLSYSAGHSVITIQDRGIGIPTAELAHISEPLFRGSNGKIFEGYGLGLTLAEKILGLHGAKLAFDSIVGQGTRVKITFPTVDC